MNNITIQLTDSLDKIEDKIVNELRTQLNSIFKRAVTGIKLEIQNLCDDVIQNTDAYQSLLGGELQGELGVPDVQDRLYNILKTIKNSIQVTSPPIQKQGKKLIGGINIGILKSDFIDILSLPSASYKTEKGTEIPWLRWLLTLGDRIIVIGYDVKLDLSPKEMARSRTGLALMRFGQGWRVPKEFAGTLESNFLTKAFNVSAVEAAINNIVIREISSRM